MLTMRNDYVLVTPVRDEVSTIRLTIAAVLKQTRKPREWVIVSDGSTDGTDEVVAAASAEYPWIRLLALSKRPTRSFAAVVRNTQIGIKALECKDYDYLGLLDADLDFEECYFERLIAHLQHNHRLGLVGGLVREAEPTRAHPPRNRADVPGAVQFFRRACFERIGGLIPIPEGGWDCLTCVMARRSGFETRLVTDLVVQHLKPRGSGEGGRLRHCWKAGSRDYALGYDPLFELVKCLDRITEPPFLMGSIISWTGFVLAGVRRRPRLISPDLVAFIRREQRERLTQAIRQPRGAQ